MNGCNKNWWCRGILSWVKEWMSSHFNTLTLWIGSQVAHLCLFLVMCLHFSLTLLAADTGNANESDFFPAHVWMSYRTIVFIYLLILIVMVHQHLLSVFLWRLLTFVYHSAPMCYFPFLYLSFPLCCGYTS